ncbi:equilibrative nucleoside transporter 1-like [Tribolium madens]|uniref:equilibrative nucleoside transporter 1-like n=1 Tax=Tribolium madens TaxID=41895 RepID=UPI001CF7497D|nr:equilibrative nucleoside transporter 1-like [Tribolium madens]
MDKSDDCGPPKDNSILIYVLFYSFGVVTVVPANFFTTATDYWMFKFRDPDSNISYNSDNRTGLQAEFTSDYIICSNVSNVLFIILTIRVLRKYLSLLYRILGGLLGLIFMFVLTCVFVRIDTDPWQRDFFVLTLITGFGLSAFSGIFMVSVFELAAKFPSKDLAPLFSGQAICGIFAALVQIFALGVGGGPATTGLIYFLLGMFFVFFTLVGFLGLWRRSKYFDFHLMKKLEATKTDLKLDKEVIKSAIKKVRLYMGSMVLVLGCTIMVHPGVTSLVVSVDKGDGTPWGDTFFGPVLNFLFFYLFDYVGREVAMYFKKPSDGFTLLVLSLLRIPFIPLLLFCNAQPRDHLGVVFNSDAVYAIFMIIFAFSNGFLINLDIIMVPKVTNDEEKPFAMLTILLLMVLSMAICAGTSAALVKAL